MSEDKSGGVELFRHTTHEIRWGKQQQWQLSYYAVLVFGAIHLLFATAREECLAPIWVLDLCFSALALFSLFIGAKVVADFQSFLVKNRLILKRIYQFRNNDSDRTRSFVTEGFIRIRDTDTLDVGFFKDAFVWVSVILFQIGAAFTVQARAYIECAWQLVAWSALDLLAVVLAVGWSLWNLPPEAKCEPTSQPPPVSPA